MAVCVTTRYRDVAPSTYDGVIASLELDVNPPAGAILHVTGEGDDGFLVTEIWQTEQTFRAFYDFRLQPALRMHGVQTEPTVEVAQLHNIFAVEMETIERLGAVSAPSHYAGAAL